MSLSVRYYCSRGPAAEPGSGSMSSKIPDIVWRQHNAECLQTNIRLVL